MGKIAIVVTSLNSLEANGAPSGFWFEELAVPYYEFRAAGHEIVIASTRGGTPTPDPWSLKDDFRSKTVEKFQGDEEAMKLLNESVKVGDLNDSELSAIFFVGGFASTYDYPNSKDCKAIVEKMAAAGKPTAAICSGVCALFEPKADGKPLLDGKSAVAITNAEVTAVGMSEALPFLPETRVGELQAKFVSKEPFCSQSIRDGTVVTGQNFASSRDTAKLVLEAMSE